MDYSNNSVDTQIDVTKNIVVIEKLNKSFLFNRKKRLILSNINFNIKEGEFICLLGPSGCGKINFIRYVRWLYISRFRECDS